jgi:hypothetical protein
MRTQITLALLAANLVLFGFIFYLNHTGHPDRVAREQTRKIFGPEATNLDFLEIRLGDEEPRVLRLESGKWQIKAPIQWPANLFAVNRILQQLEFLEKETSFRTGDLARTGQTLEQYGLETPQATLLFGRGSRRQQVSIGAPTDVGNRLYILDPTGEWIHVVHREFAEALSLNLEQLQSETIFHIPLFEVRSLNLQVGTHSRVRLDRNETNWRFETPFQTGADRRVVESVINRLNGLQIRRFESSLDVAEAGLDNPMMRITLEGNSRRETLLVGNPVPRHPGRVYAKLADNPTIFTLDSEPLQVFENAQDLLRNRKLLEISPDRVTSVKVEAPGQSDVLLQRLETNEWQIVSRYADQSVRILPAGKELVDRLLASLDETYVLRFENDAPSDADLARYGFDRPQRIVNLEGDTSISLILGAHVPDSEESTLYAKLSNSRFVHTLDASLLRETPADENHFRDRLLLPQPAGATITSLKIRDLTSDELVFESALSPSATTWEEAVADLPAVQGEAVLALLPELRNLKVESYVRDNFFSVIELDGETIEFAFALEAELLLVGGETSTKSNLELQLTNRLGGQTLLGGSRRLNVTFSLRQNFIDALAPLLSAPPPVENEEKANLSPREE